VALIGIGLSAVIPEVSPSMRFMFTDVTTRAGVAHSCVYYGVPAHEQVRLRRAGNRLRRQVVRLRAAVFRRKRYSSGGRSFVSPGDITCCYQ
jgi:hypothetical protein